MKCITWDDVARRYVRGKAIIFQVVAASDSSAFKLTRNTPHSPTIDSIAGEFEIADAIHRLAVKINHPSLSTKTKTP